MENGKWRFKKHDPGDTIRDPVAGEFFSTNAISNPAEAVVREGIQNALDARLAPEFPVRIRIFLGVGDKTIAEKWINNVSSG